MCVVPGAQGNPPVKIRAFIRLEDDVRKDVHRMSDQLQVILIAVGVIIGIVGIVFLLQKTREYRTVGLLIFPLMPSIILFAISFGSSASATFGQLGTFGGPIAAYIALVILGARYINKDLNIQDQSRELNEAKTQLDEYKVENTSLKSKVETLTAELGELREKIETARPKPLASGIDATYSVPRSQDQQILIRTGNIRSVRDIDVIVNSENTDMLLARFYERSLSATLRYMDAIKGMDGRVVQDSLAESLSKVIQENNIRLPVQAGVVIPTGTAGLQENGIRYVFHVAAVQGSVEAGYEPVTSQLPTCIDNVFSTARRINKELSETKDAVPLQSMLFPLLGAGTAKLSPHESADIMLAQIVACLESTPAIKKVYLLAFIESHRTAMRNAAMQLGLKLVEGND
jgi:O-acetyl-ADP-ribose deacetylase (regulator of RNase III)